MPFPEPAGTIRIVTAKMEIDKLIAELQKATPRAVGRAMTIVENNGDGSDAILSSLNNQAIDQSLILGITGPPGAGKSTLTSSLIRLLRQRGKRVGIIAIDPSSPISGGAILGDRVRMMNHALDENVIARSMASRGRLGGLCASAGAIVRIMGSCGCDMIIIETVGVGQSEMDIIRLADVTLMVLAPGFGDDIQAMKAGLLEVADLIAVNKSDLPGAEALCMDMEQMFHATDDDLTRVIKTESINGKGVEELLDIILQLSEWMRKSGEWKKRRFHSLDMETLDWSLELIKPLIWRKIQDHSGQGDPRIRAQKIINTLGDLS